VLSRRTPMRRTAIKAGLSPKQKRDAAEMRLAERELKVRSQGICEFSTFFEPRCVKRATVRHHVVMRSQGGGNDASNLLHLCSAHHEYVHAHPAESLERGHLKHWEPKS
jgi:hypothetical protein